VLGQLKIKTVCEYGRFMLKFMHAKIEQN